MKREARHGMWRAIVALMGLGLGALPLSAQSTLGLPEPGLLMYGSVTNTAEGGLTCDVPLRWTITVGGSSINVTSTWVVVNGQAFHLTRVPFDTRTVAGNPVGTTPNTLELTAGATTYTRSVKMGTTNVGFVNPAQATFAFSGSSRGLIERVDLSVAYKETYEQWSMRWFGRVSPRTEDADGDGVSNYDEFVAATDPTSSASLFGGVGIAPNPAGGIQIYWPSVAGRSYSVERSVAVPGGFVVVQGNIVATPAHNTFVDATATEPGPHFYRIGVQK